MLYLPAVPPYYISLIHVFSFIMNTIVLNQTAHFSNLDSKNFKCEKNGFKIQMMQKTK